MSLEDINGQIFQFCSSCRSGLTPSLWFHAYLAAQKKNSNNPFHVLSVMCQSDLTLIKSTTNRDLLGGGDVRRPHFFRGAISRKRVPVTNKP